MAIAASKGGRVVEALKAARKAHDVLLRSRMCEHVALTSKPLSEPVDQALAPKHPCPLPPLAPRRRPRRQVLIRLARRIFECPGL